MQIFVKTLTKLKLLIELMMILIININFSVTTSPFKTITLHTKLKSKFINPNLLSYNQNYSKAISQT